MRTNTAGTRDQVDSVTVSLTVQSPTAKSLRSPANLRHNRRALRANPVAARPESNTAQSAYSHASSALGVGPSRELAAGEDAPLLVNGGIRPVISRFSRKFPELRFFHDPSFIKSLEHLDCTTPNQASSHGNSNAGTSSSHRLLYSSLVALCLPLIDSDRQGGDTSPTAEDFASYARDRISLTEPPNLSLFQALVVLSMYEWGIGCGYRAWTYSGMATRIMQSLQVLSPRHTLRGTDLEIYNRTLWSCFIVDRVVYCGKPQPFMLTSATLYTHWPISEEDFAFGEPSTRPHGTDGDQVRGFDIWARILKWVVSGGRRLPGMSLPANHPWADGSPWCNLYRELQAWRGQQDKRLHYAEGHAKKHAALGQAEAFGFLNLIYYISLIFLLREYVPFLPAPESEPAGPVDPPLLPAPAPSGWWHDRADELFTSAAKIPLLLQELKDANASLETPFAGFCAFSAATMNLYVSSFPNMNLKRSADTSFDVAVLNLRLLDRFRAVWPMGEGWRVTIQHCKGLYDHASRDTVGSRGRTRDDFIALEYSIRDSRSQPPTSSQHELDVPADNNEEQADPRAVDQHVEPQGSWIDASDAHNPAARGLSHIPEEYQGGTAQNAETWMEQASGEWWQSWPLWGDHQNIPYAVEGIPFDYNLDTLAG
ncbi:hypothetical protein G7046_g2074 [Stylonectria norvegica]|nr:hypothetical protein G7046_g2074 [Stylonectria norvegica]